MVKTNVVCVHVNMIETAMIAFQTLMTLILFSTRPNQFNPNHPTNCFEFFIAEPPCFLSMTWLRSHCWLK